VSPSASTSTSPTWRPDYERAKAAGAKVLREPREPGYGDRRYDVEDLEGHRWFFATQLEER
jgi:uncharacterized glyoxalase superfamily protein PhnB